MPSTAEIASGTADETFSAPDWTFSAAPLFPSHRRARPIRAAFRPSAEGPEGSPVPRPPAGPGTAARSRARRALSRSLLSPQPVRGHAVFLITNRTGYSNTSARKIPMKTIRNVSPIAQNAASNACCRSDQQHRSHRQEQRSHWRRADCRVIRSGHQDLGSVGATRRRSSGVIKWSLSTVGLLRADDPKPCKAYPTSLGLVESRRDNVPCRGDRSCGLDMLPWADDEDRQGHDGRPDGHARPRAGCIRARLCVPAI